MRKLPRFAHSEYKLGSVGAFVDVLMQSRMAENTTWSPFFRQVKEFSTGQKINLKGYRLMYKRFLLFILKYKVIDLMHIDFLDSS